MGVVSCSRNGVNPVHFLCRNFRNMDLKIIQIVRKNSQPIWHLPFEDTNFYEWLNQIFALTRVNIRTSGISQTIEIHYH